MLYDRWSELLNIGDEKLDHQHKKIFYINEKISELIQKNPKNDEDIQNLKKFVIKLFSDLKNHFVEEEKYMENINFPLLKEHKQLHNEILKKCKDIVSNINDIENLSKEISKILQNFWIDHVINGDILINNYDKKAISIDEFYYDLDAYLDFLKSYYLNDYKEEFDYVCYCELKIHKIPSILHNKLQKSNKNIRCTSCGQNLVFLQENFQDVSLEELKNNFIKLKQL